MEIERIKIYLADRLVEKRCHKPIKIKMKLFHFTY